MTAKEMYQVASESRLTSLQKNLLDCCLNRIKCYAEKGYFELNFSIFDKIYPRNIVPAELESVMKQLESESFGFKIAKHNEAVYIVNWEFQE